VGELSLSIAPELFEKVPDYRRAVLVGRREREADTDAIERGLQATNEQWRSHSDEVTDVPSVARWRKAYRAVGLNPTKTRPAVEALIRRAKAGGVASLGRPAVDAGTIATLRAQVPVGVHVLDDVGDGLTLAPAGGGETFTAFDGNIEHPEPGEIVWVSGEDVLTRRWVHKQGAFGSVTPTSTSFAVNVDLLGEDDPERGAEIVTEWLTAAGIAVTGSVLLDRVQPSATVDSPESS
jgi:DNA/RNA-binding domain of Phe-tRNA-synthetase-like protein